MQGPSTCHESVTAMAVEEGFSSPLDFSPISGHGNIEFLAYLKRRKSASNQFLLRLKKQ